MSIQNLKRYSKIYFLLLRKNIKARMEFSLDFIISCFGILAVNLSAIAAIVIMFQNTESIGGFSYHEVLFMYSLYLVVITPQQIFCDNIWGIWNYFVDGSFIKYLLKPIDSLFYFISEKIDLKGFAQLFFALGILFYSAKYVNYSWDFISVFWLVVLMVSSSSILMSLMLMAASTGFWILDPYEVITVVNKVKDFGRYPTSIYNIFFQVFFTTILPIGFLAYYPSLSFVESKMSVITFFTPVVAIVFLFLTRLVWKKGLEYYKPTGS